MIRKCRFTKRDLWHYRRFAFGPFCPYEIECRMKDGKADWVVIWKNEHDYSTNSISREEAKKYINDAEEELEYIHNKS